MYNREFKLSKLVRVRILCPTCKTNQDVELYRSLWIEYPSNRRLITDNQLNLVRCQKCHVTTRIEFPVLCTNVQRKIAIWYEPYPDPQVDADIRQYSQHFGPDSFYAQAPRIRSWEEFKKKLALLEAPSQKDMQQPKLKPSPEIGPALSTFINSFPESQTTRLPHIQRPLLRLAYAGLPMTALILFAFWNHRAEFDAWLDDVGSEILLYFVIVTGLLYGLLSVINALVNNIDAIPSKDLRVYLFLSTFWSVTSFIVLWLFDPFDYGRFRYMDSSEISQILFIVLGFPLLIGLALLCYKKFVV
ncbi:MAG: hypothetical protein C0442_10260 [Chlorobiaceae bacterium]|nr:hypothetical protein [Chlorobiaceae bacterium]